MARKISGNVRVENRKKLGRVWVAQYMTAGGTRTNTVIGPAWVVNSGERTAKGGIRWRTAPGSCPEGHLTPAMAREALQQLVVAERAKPEQNVRHRGRTVEDAYKLWIADREEKLRSESTLRGYRQLASADILPLLGHNTPLRRIGWTQIEKLRAHAIETKPTLSTARAVMIATNGIFATAKRKRWIAANPCEDVEKIAPPKRGTSLGHFLSASDVFTVSGAMVTPVGDEDASELQERLGMFSMVVVFAAFTGLRTGELRALRWEDVVFTTSQLHVRRNLPTGADSQRDPKSNVERMVPLIPQAAKVADALSRRGYLTGPTDRVFPGDRNGEPLAEGAMRDAFYEGLQRAGLGRLRVKGAPGDPSPLRFHDLRHTFGTLGAQAYPLRDLQAYMGHANISTTEIYLHAIPKHEHAAIMGDLVAAQVDPYAAVRGEQPARH